MSNQPSRRDVLKTTAAAAVGMSLVSPGSAKEALASLSVAPEAKDGDEKRIRFAIVGCGGKGWSGMQAAAQHGDIVALCDIDANNRGKALAEYPRANTFVDYREMYQAIPHLFDAVVVSIPDHSHAPASALAMKIGKHVYCEKPLTRSISEARMLAQLARKHRVATQMGNQGTSNSNLRRTAAALQAGAFGQVREIHCWTDRAGGWWPQGVDRPTPALPPREVDWELWLGPRPRRAYAPGYHPFAWRGWWDFGSGALGDIGCHCMNLPFMAFDLRDPIAVQAQTSGHNRDSYPAWSIVKYEFGPRRGRPAVNLTWYDGGKRPPESLAPSEKYQVNGCLVVCEKATLFSANEYGTDFRIVGGGSMPDVKFEESPGHMAEFARAIRGGPPARSNFPDYSGPLTEMVVMGNLAVWANGPRLEWDAGKMKVRGTDEFDSIIYPQNRYGWDF